MGKISILLIEDEYGIRNFMEKTLTIEGYKVLVAANGREAMSMLTSETFDVVILDLGLPDMKGEEIIIKLREWSSIPIIVVSARNSEEQKVAILDLGADDYITKPFGVSELLARIRNAYRHSVRICSNGNVEHYRYQCGDLTVDLKNRQVMLHEERIHLTQLEFKILALLVKNAGKVLTYETIIRDIWGPLAMKQNQILRVNMANIRRKIEDNPASPQYIFTEMGVGYRIVEED